MNVESEKALYENEFREVAQRFNADIFIWGEELADKKMILYPKNLKNMKGYQKVKETLEPCGIVLVDVRREDFLRCISATTDVATGNVYLPESVFNAVWKTLRNSVRAGIHMEEQEGSCVITKPEDIVVLDNLKRSGSNPVIREGAIRYEQKVLTTEERHKNSRKQSLLDNPKMLYFYGEHEEYFHDRDCDFVKKIPPEQFRASDTFPLDKTVCPKCRRKIYLRKACYPNAKQLPVLERIFREQGVGMGRLEHCVVDVGMKFHATSLEKMVVENAEDTWQIRGLHSGEIELWHNNYVRTSPTERYITDGFHKQWTYGTTLAGMLNYIEHYSWEVHLKREAEKAMAVETEIRQTGTPEVETIPTVEPERVAWHTKLRRAVKAVFGKLSNRFAEWRK